MNKINIIIEPHEASVFPVHPITGRSGKVYGHATFDTKRGCLAFRMTLEEWRAAKDDICLSRHKFYPLKWDVEVEVVEEEQSEAVSDADLPAHVLAGAESAPVPPPSAKKAKK